MEYLESVHIGEFLTGTHREVQQNISSMIQHDYVNPTETLPVSPPPKCTNAVECGSASNAMVWKSGAKVSAVR